MLLFLYYIFCVFHSGLVNNFYNTNLQASFDQYLQTLLSSPYQELYLKKKKAKFNTHSCINHIVFFASTLCVSQNRRNLENCVMEFKTEQRAHEETQQTTDRTTDH